MQVQLDVNRSFWRFPDGNGIAAPKKLSLRKRLTKVMSAILSSDDALHYYQGFHEICAVVMLNTDAHLALGLVSRITRSAATHPFPPSPNHDRLGRRR